MNIQLNGPKILWTLHTNTFLGDLHITQTLVMSWIVMAIVTGLCIWLGHGLRVENVSRRQAVAEMLVTKLEGFVHDNMGPDFDRYIPLVGALFACSVFSNLISLLGFWSPTADLSTEAGWAIVVFVLITYHKIRASGIGQYLLGYLKPIFIMAPINVISEFATPVSMACRHFGNILSGMVISTLIYASLAGLSGLLFGWLPGAAGQVLGAIPFFDVGIPAFLSLYFDWFSGCIQAFIFCTLTTIYIRQAAEG